MDYKFWLEFCPLSKTRVRTWLQGACLTYSRERAVCPNCQHVNCELLISKWVLLIAGFSYLFIKTGYREVQRAHTFCQLWAPQIKWHLRSNSPQATVFARFRWSPPTPSSVWISEVTLCLCSWQPPRKQEPLPTWVASSLEIIWFNVLILHGRKLKPKGKWACLPSPPAPRPPHWFWSRSPKALR